MSSVLYSLLFIVFFAILQSVSSKRLYEWNVERSSVNPLSYTDETHYSRERTESTGSSLNLRCPDNEHFSRCDSNCQVTCKNYRKPSACSGTPCRYGCVCNSGLVRGPDEKCIQPSECPDKSNAEVENLYVTLNPPPYTDDDYHIPSSVTKLPPYSKTENPQFKETEPYATETFHKCPKGRQQWVPCGGHCQRNCSNKDDEEEPCKPVCIPGCICEKGLVEGPDGECIEKDKCPRNSDSEQKPSHKCPKDRQQWVPCGGHCQRNCSNKDDEEEPCKPVCIPGCICEKGLVEGPDGECIEKDKCPRKSDSEQNFHVTLNPPPYTNDDYHIPSSGTKFPPESKTENPQFEETEPPPPSRAVSEDIKLTISPNAGCPNENECLLTCQHFGHRSGYCAGPYRLICFCRTREHENAEHDKLRSRVIPCFNNSACDNMCKNIKHKIGGKCVGALFPFCYCY